MLWSQETFEVMLSVRFTTGFSEGSTLTSTSEPSSHEYRRLQMAGQGGVSTGPGVRD